jgi:hypothetical protein
MFIAKIWKKNIYDNICILSYLTHMHKTLQIWNVTINQK